MELFLSRLSFSAAGAPLREGDKNARVPLSLSPLLSRLLSSSRARVQSHQARTYIYALAGRE